MRRTPHPTAIAPDDGAITISLSAAQLKALGLHKPPAPGAEVQLRATATVAHPDAPASAADADQDGDQDGDQNGDQDGDQDGDQNGGDYAQGGDTDADRADDNGTTQAGADRQGTQGDAGDTAALRLRLTGLTLTQPRKTPDKVLYGGGD